MMITGHSVRKSKVFRAAAVVMSVLVISMLAAPVTATAQVTRSAVTRATAPTGAGGWSLAVDGSRALAVHDGCSKVATGTSAPFGAIDVSAIGGAKPSTLSVGSAKWTIEAGQAFSTVAWSRMSAGSLSVCATLADLHSLSLRLLAHAVTPSVTSPGGRFNITARIPLPSAGATKGTWTLPAQSVPSSAAGVLLQVWSSGAGVAQVRSGSTVTPVVVGSGVPASTVVVPPAALSWTRSAGTGQVNAELLGYVSARSDPSLNGSRLHLLSFSFAASGSLLHLAGSHGIPSASAAIPATSVLASVQGSGVAVEDSLAAGRQTPTGATSTSLAPTFLRLAGDGALHLSTSAHLVVTAWLSGDEVRAPHSLDLTQAGSPQPTAAPAPNQLTFSGQRPFYVGESLVLGVTTFTPDGLIAVVDAVSTTATTTTVTYHAGKLLDAFSQMDLVSQIPVGSSASTPSAAVAEPHNVTPINLTKGLDFSRSAQISFGPVSGSVSFDFHPSMTLVVTIDTSFGAPTGVNIYYGLDSNTTLTASLSASASVSGSKSVDLGTLKLGAFEIGPVVVVPELSASLDLEASLNAAITWQRSISEHAHAGMTLAASFTHGFNGSHGDAANGIGSPQINNNSTEISVGADASASLSARFILAFFGVAGPNATASASIGLHVNPLGSPRWDVDANADFSIGIDLNALGVPLLTRALNFFHIPTDPSWTLGHFEHSWQGNDGTTIGVSTGPSSGGSGSGSSGSGPTNGGTGVGGPPGTGNVGTTAAPPGAVVTVAQGPAAPFGYRYAVTLHGFVPNSYVGIECYDTQDPGGYYYFVLGTDGSGNAFSQSYCYSATGPDYWVVAGGLQSPSVQWGSDKSGSLAGASLQIGWSSSHPGWITMTLNGFPTGTYTYSCDFGSGGDQSFSLTAGSEPETFDNGHTCFDLESGDTVWVTIGSVQSNTITVGGATSSPPPAGASLQIGWSGSHPGWITMTLNGFPTGSYTYSCDFGSGGDASFVLTASSEPMTFDNGHTCFDLEGGDTVWVTIGSVQSNTITVGQATPVQNPTPPATFSETVGGDANTWTNYTNAGGTHGPTIPAFNTVQIACALTGFRVPDGNTWWYRIASSPWNNAFYVSADPFYNNGATSGPLHGTPFVDPAVPNCSSLSSTYAETTGGSANTWSNYANAGGNQGPTIGGQATIQVACRLQGFTVPDGDNWWYRVASNPWNNGYYVSADAFYNNGATSGSLIGTPFVDSGVATC